MIKNTSDRLHYHVIETGKGAPLVLLHGFTGSSQEWLPFIPDLAAHFRVIAVDLPGHGQTQGPGNCHSYQMPAIADELESILHDRQAHPAYWLGYSMGGRLAIYIAVHRPQLVKSLILESASPGLATAAERRLRREQDEALALRIETHGVPAFVAEWEKLPLFDSQRQLSPQTREALRQRRLTNKAGGLASSLRGMGTGVQPSLWADLPTASVETLLLAGELDSKFVTINQRMAANMPNAQLRIVPKAGHAIHLEQPEVFMTEVLRFLHRRKPNGQYLPGAE